MYRIRWGGDIGKIMALDCINLRVWRLNYYIESARTLACQFTRARGDYLWDLKGIMGMKG